MREEETDEDKHLLDLFSAESKYSNVVKNHFKKILSCKRLVEVLAHRLLSLNR
jgi:hypothetical protein